MYVYMYNMNNIDPFDYTCIITPAVHVTTVFDVI